MTRTWKDTVATASVAIVVIFYLGYLMFGSMPFVEDVRGMAAVGLVLSFASRRVGGRHGFQHERAALAANFGSLALGFVALATENGVVLALFIVSVVVLWLAATYVRTGGFHIGRLHSSH
jgi:hypothetical protein